LSVRQKSQKRKEVCVIKQRSISKDSSRLAELIESYFDSHTVDSGEIADTEGLAEHLGITRDELLNFKGNKKSVYAVKRALNRIAMIKKQLAFRGKIPATVFTFDLKNNHGYLDKPEPSDSEQGVGVVFRGKAGDWAK